MSVEAISIGDELRDSFKTTYKWVNNGINWIDKIEDFYRERAQIEQEYATKLKDLCGRNFEIKARLSSLLSVGDQPKVTPGSLESASLVLWNELLTQTEAISDEKVRLSKEINLTLSEKLALLKGKSGRIAKQIEEIGTILVNEKTKTEEEVHKAKKDYDAACVSTESARQKAEKSAGDKAQQKLRAKEVDMNVAKNAYLIKINIANRLKDKYYYQDVPELLDYLQELNQVRVGILNKLLKNASIIERNANERVKEKLNTIDATVDQNDPKLDVAMFVKHNASDWNEPDDFYFVPSDIWHDDESLVTKEPELTELKRELNKSFADYSKFEEVCTDLKQKLEEVTADRKKGLADCTLSFDTFFFNSLSVLSRYLKSDTERVKAEVEIEVVQNYAGDKDLSYTEIIEEKKSTFGFLRGKKHSSVTTTADNASDNKSIHTVKSATSQKITPSSFFNLRKGKQTTDASTGVRGHALYAYQASGEDETSISAGEQIQIIEQDDGSGWTQVKSSAGEGLVPTSYIEIVQSQASTGTKKKGPSVAPRRGAKKVEYVEALYPYEADGDDELTILPGDKIIVLQSDIDGSGWTEGEVNGQRGMFPTSYVKKL